MKNQKGATVVMLAMVFFLCLVSEVMAGNQKALEERLLYLYGLPGVISVVFDRNNVYVEFKKGVRDMKSIISAAAMHGNRAYGYGVHVWACANKFDGNISNLSYYYEVSCRHGRFE